MTLLELANNGFALATGLVGVVVWFVRLESRQKASEKSIESERREREKALAELKDAAEKQVLTMWAKIDLMNGSIVQILQSTARLETVLRLKQNKE